MHNAARHQMSGSNATHVRLLNASLESEGAYACEISSENLSTIRHEREIKVYGESGGGSGELTRLGAPIGPVGAQWPN